MSKFMSPIRSFSFMILFICNFYLAAVAAEATAASAPPSFNSEAYSEQWALTNPIFGIQPVELKESPGSLLGSGGIGHKVVVAIIDSGIDPTHPDLKDVLHESVREKGAIEKLLDGEGHGTHIAGIIGAQGKGVEGVLRNITLIPIRVLKSAEASIQMVDQIANAIKKSIELKAQVINLSLGWPEILNSNKINEALALAEANQVLIVVAAGNDHTEAVIEPCHRPQVICVASHDMFGSFAKDSNFGVDISAPGERILSTYPVNKRSLLFLLKRGYDYKSGTSMAAPFVSGVLAKLLARGFSPYEAKARLLAGALPWAVTSSSGSGSESGNGSGPQNGSYSSVQFGRLSERGALAAEPKPLLMNLNKKPQPLNWNGFSGQQSVKIPVKLRNIWTAGRVFIRAEVRENSFLKIENERNRGFTFGPVFVAENQELEFEVPVVALSEDFPADFHLELTIQTIPPEASFFDLNKADKQIPLQKLTLPMDVVRTIGGSDNDDQGLGVQHFAIDPLQIPFRVRTVETPIESLPSQQAKFAVFEGGGRVKLYSSQFELLDKGVIDIPSQELMSIHNLGSSIAFIFRMPAQKDTYPNGGVVVDYYSKLGKKLFRLTNDNSLVVMKNDVRWMAFENTFVPAWIARGKIPKSPDPWKTREPELIMRFYYLTPGGLKWVEPREDEGIGSEIFVSVLNSSPFGEVHVVSAVGEGYLTSYQTSVFKNGIRQDQGLTELNPFRQLLGVAQLDWNEFEGRRQTLFWSAYGPKNTKMRITNFDSKEDWEVDSVTNPLVNLVYFDSVRSSTWVLNAFDIERHSPGEPVQRISQNRMSFVPSLFSLNSWYPVKLGRQVGVYLPGGTFRGLAQDVILEDTVNKKLYRSAKWRLAPGVGCEAVDNPQVVYGHSRFVFFCRQSAIAVE